MGSPITFSGFNDIDFNLILNAVMQQASVPLSVLQSRQAGVESQIKTYGTLSSQLLELKDAAAGLRSATQVSTLSGTTSNPSSLSASVGPGATPGRLEVVVNQLARAQVTVSASSAPDAATTAIATGGSLTIGGVDVAIAGDTTLQQLADAINGTDGIGVNAAVVRTGSDTYRLALTSRETGAANAFTIVNNLTGGHGVTFTDTDGDNISGDSPADNAVTATDASILLNNIPVTGSSNTFSEVVSGVTLTVLRQDPADTIAVDIAVDATALRDKVESFIQEYNALIEFQNSQRGSNGEVTAGSIGTDPMLRSLRNVLRAELLGSHGTGVYTRLSEVGIELTRTGTLTLNEAAFNAAVASDADAVRDLFGGTAGVFRTVEAHLTEYTQTGGFIPSITDRLKRQVSAMEDQVVAMQARLAIQRDALLREFGEADRAMTRLRDQAGSLASFGSRLGSL